MFEILRSFIRVLGLQALAMSLLEQASKVKHKWVVVRDGIRYQLDVRKTIDFGIFSGGWERTTIRFIKNNLKPQHVVIEVGANIGAHTLLMAKMVGPGGFVYAFEPTEFALLKLRKNLSLNPALNNVKVVDCLVSNSSETAAAKVIINSDWSLDGVQRPEVLINKKIVTIDEFVHENKIARLDFLKVDVDGYDLKVLQGAKDTINSFKPIIFCELCEYVLNQRGDSVNGIFEYLFGMGYECFDEIYDSPMSLSVAKETIGLTTSINGIFRFKETPEELT
jgi:FkbM family methyltransferase